MDIDKIKTLVELMVDNDLSRIEIQEGESHILLRRGHAPVVSAMAAQAFTPPPVAAAQPAPAATAAAPVADTAAPPAAPASNEVLIRSPMVGTFYASSSPDAAAFVRVGDTIGPDSVVCLIEAMKVFNEIKAETSGRITRMLVQNAQAVEYDQPLFAVSPA